MALVDGLLQKIEINHGSHHRISSVEGLRALSVTLVFFVHYSAIIGPWIDKVRFNKEIYRFLGFYGNFGVELFFVISGYLIYSIVIRPQFAMKIFFLKRIQRIYPTFLAVLSLYVVISLVIPSESKLPGSSYAKMIYIVDNLLLLPGMLDIKPLITVSWTLSYEAFFYFALPVLFAVTNFRGVKPKNRTLILGLSVLCYWAFCMVWDVGISRISVFALGCLAYEVKDTIPKFKLATLTGIFFFTLSLSTTYAYVADMIGYKTNYLISTVSLFVFYNCVMITNSRINKVFSYRYFRWYGNISYSYFLFHGLCLKIIFYVFAKYYPPGHNQVGLYFGLAPVCLIMTILLSTAFYLCVEYPFSLKNPIRDYCDLTNRCKLYRQQIATFLRWSKATASQ